MSHAHSRFMRASITVAITLLLALGAACKPKPEVDSFIIMTATPSLAKDLGPTSTPEPTVPYVISGIPHCQGLRDLGSPLRFEWPNIETAIEKLADYEWGYYACSLSQSALKSFIRDNMVKPPYLWQEMTWVENGESSGALYFHSAINAWIYLWMLPQSDKRNSYLVIAKGDPGMPQTWECLRQTPDVVGFDDTCSICPRRVN